MRILIVEDEPSLAELIRDHLCKLSYAVDLAGSLDESFSLLSAGHFDAVVLDLSLPDGDGMDLLRYLRAKEDAIPVLAATARDEVSDRIQSLDQGMDDYLVKPYDLGELSARLKALLRRAGRISGGRRTIGNVSLDTVSRSVEVDERPLVLGRRQLMLLETLMLSKDHVVLRQHIEDSLYGIDDVIDSNALDANVSRLRKILNDNRADVVIHTVRGVGYMLTQGGTA